MSADIKTHYTLKDNTVTRSEGGSSVKVSTGEDSTAKLLVYVSADRNTRDCALITDFPGQLVKALGLELDDLFDLDSLLKVPLVSLKTLLIRKGITGGHIADDSEEPFRAVTVNGILQRQSDGIHNNDSSDTSTEFAKSVRSDSVESGIMESARASATSVIANTTLPPCLDHQPISRSTTPQPRLQDHLNAPSDENPREGSVTPGLTAAGLYSTDNRSQNRQQLQAFARNENSAAFSGSGRTIGQFGSDSSAFDMGTLREALGAAESAPVQTSIHVSLSSRRRAGLIPNRNEGEMARDFEVGFLGEQFVSSLNNPACRICLCQKLNLLQVYTLLLDTLELPNFTAEDNWTSSLRSRAGFSTFGREVSDFTYKDTQGTLTRHFSQMRHAYTMPEWLITACDNGNAPLYRLEVKSTTSQDPTTTFYMSSGQHKLVSFDELHSESADHGADFDQAEKLRVTSMTPTEIYVVLRVSGLDALEDGATHRPQWRVYLDPYTRGVEGVLSFVAPTYAVTAAA